MSGIEKTIRAANSGVAVVALAALAGLAIGGSAAIAGSSTDWQKANHASTRLVVDTIQMKDGKTSVVAGIQVKLDDGWKTYWRNPGDAGLPPHFDWSGSTNLKAAQVLWPAPHRFKDSAGTSYGYKKEVVLPVIITPQDPSKPVHLRLNLEYAVCADICIPAQAELSIKSGKSGLFSSSFAELLQTYLGLVPPRREIGTTDPVGVKDAQADLTGSDRKLAIDVKFPQGAADKDVFVEGPEGFYLPPTVVQSSKPNGLVRYVVDLASGDDPKTLAGQELTITVTSDKARAEVPWRLK